MALCRRVFTDQSWPHRLSLVGRAGMFSCVTGVDTTTISTENRELPLAKIYENSSLDYSFFRTFDPRSNAGLLRERIRHDHDQNSTSSAGTHYGGLLPLLIAAAPFSGAKMNLPLFGLARLLVRLDHVAGFAVREGAARDRRQNRRSAKRPAQRRTSNSTLSIREDSVT